MKVTDKLALEGLRGKYRVPQGAKICYSRDELEDMKLSLEAVFALIEKESADNAQSKDDIFNSMPPELPLLDEKPEDDGWIEWDNPDYNASPDIDNILVATKWRDGSVYEYGMLVNNLKWHNIIAYRIIDKPEPEKEAPKEKPEWDSQGAFRKIFSSVPYNPRLSYSVAPEKEKIPTFLEYYNFPRQKMGQAPIVELISLYLDKYMKEKD